MKIKIDDEKKFSWFRPILIATIGRWIKEIRLQPRRNIAHIAYIHNNGWKVKVRRRRCRHRKHVECRPRKIENSKRMRMYVRMISHININDMSMCGARCLLLHAPVSAASHQLQHHPPHLMLFATSALAHSFSHTRGMLRPFFSS